MIESTSPVQGLSESHQQLRKAEELSRIVTNKKDLYENKEAWTYHQELTSIYRNLLLLDLEFSLDKKVEQDLWNICFKNYISHLQTRIRDKRANVRGDSQLLLSWFLEFASGFYTTFLTEIQQKFQLDIPFLKSGDPYGIWGESGSTKKKSSERPGVTSCNYLCQHCLVHLGDVARYRNQMKQAETFYRHAISMAPGSGQPYNQIAILEASRSNKLSAVYFYVRAICLKYPFPAASTNLGKMLNKLSGFDHEKAGKMNQLVFISTFLKLHGLLHHAEKLRHAVRISNLLAESLTSLIVSDSLSTWQLLQVININMWAYSHVSSDFENSSKEEKLTAGLVANCQAALLSSCLLPVYTLQKGDQLLEYFALPAVRLLLEWIKCQPDVLTEKGFTTRPQIWPGLARLLNEIKPLIADFDSSQLSDYPLPEDYDMQAFSPLQTMLSKYNMKQVLKGGIKDTNILSKLRCTRLIEVGHFLCQFQPKVITYSDETKLFEAVDIEWKLVKDDPETLVEEIEMLEDIDSSEDSDSPLPVWEDSNSGSTQEGTKSILKMKSDPSPSTPSPISSPHPSTSVTKSKPKLFQRNVAMAAILNTMESSGNDDKENPNLLGDGKKVMFKTPSPSNSQTSTVDSQVCGSQDETPVSLAANASVRSSRRPWSPSPVQAPTQPPGPIPRSKICVDELDFSVPPPSLHSNVRPPSLFSPPGMGSTSLGPPGLGIPSGGPPSRHLVSGIQPLRTGDMKETFPGGSGGPLPLPGSYAGGQTLLPGLSSLAVSDWPRPERVGQSRPPAPVRPPGPVTPGGHNPLLQLISNVERPDTLVTTNSGGDMSQYAQSYSLFSPSSWPGPSSILSPSQQGQPPPGHLPMFGSGMGGPSPLEKLLHQSKQQEK